MGELDRTLPGRGAAAVAVGARDYLDVRRRSSLLLVAGCVAAGLVRAEAGVAVMVLRRRGRRFVAHGVRQEAPHVPGARPARAAVAVAQAQRVVRPALHQGSVSTTV